MDQKNQEMLLSKGILKEGMMNLLKQGPLVFVLCVFAFLFWTKAEKFTDTIIQKYNTDNLELKTELKRQREQSIKDRQAFLDALEDCMKSK